MILFHHFLKIHLNFRIRNQCRNLTTLEIIRCETKDDEFLAVLNECFVNIRNLTLLDNNHLLRTRDLEIRPFTQVDKLLLDASTVWLVCRNQKDDYWATLLQIFPNCRQLKLYKRPSKMKSKCTTIDPSISKLVKVVNKKEVHK